MTSSSIAPCVAACPADRCERPGARPQSGTIVTPASRASASSASGFSAAKLTSTSGRFASIAARIVP